MTASSQSAPWTASGIVAASVMPMMFIILWSSGYIAGAIGLVDAEPFTMTTYRFAAASALLLIIALIMRAPWPTSRAQAGHIAMVGVLIQATQFAALYSAMKLGVPAGVTALIIGTMPIFTAIGAGFLLNERVSERNWIGLLLGLGGVAIVVGPNVSFTGDYSLGVLFAVIGLFGIVSGTLYQKKYCSQMDLRTGGCIQLGVAAVILLVLSLSFETMTVAWTEGFIGSLIWLALMNSIGAISLLYMMIRRGEASKVASLFYLVPGCTAIMAYATLDEILSPVAILGFAIAATGVYLSTRKA